MTTLLTFLMLKPAVLQVILNTAFKFLRVIVVYQDGNKGVQGIESFLEKRSAVSVAGERC